MRYGRLEDPEHEYFFAGDTVPALIKAHGWRDEVLDFVFRVLFRNYYDTLDNYAHVWYEWGMRDAAVQWDSAALARHLTSLYAEDFGTTAREGSFGHSGLKQLARQILQPHSAWESVFFAEAGRLLEVNLTDGS
jgi:hypothetical protein